MKARSHNARHTRQTPKAILSSQNPLSLTKQSQPRQRPAEMLFQFNSSNTISPTVLCRRENEENLHLSTNSEQTYHDQSDDSQTSDFSHLTRHSLTSSSSVPAHSPEETFLRGKLLILNDIYPSSEHEEVNGIPLALLGAEKRMRIRLDWRRVRYPLSAYHTEIIIDLFLARPALVREIPTVHNFSLYRPLTRTVRGWDYLLTSRGEANAVFHALHSELFFDHGNDRAALHQCHRKQIHGTLPRSFTIDDLITIHQREFHLITYNTTREARFLNLFECLFPVYVHQSRSTDWKVYLTKSARRKTMLDCIGDVPRDTPQIRHLSSLLTSNQLASPSPSERRMRRRKESRVQFERHWSAIEHR